MLKNRISRDGVAIEAQRHLPGAGEPIRMTFLHGMGEQVLQANSTDDSGRLVLMPCDALVAWRDEPMEVSLGVGFGSAPMGVVNRAVLHGLLDLWLDRQ